MSDYSSEDSNDDSGSDSDEVSEDTGFPRLDWTTAHSLLARARFTVLVFHTPSGQPVENAGLLDLIHEWLASQDLSHGGEYGFAPGLDFADRRFDVYWRRHPFSS
jgi:hypothetical protein